ncbi:MAG: ABC transporter ATP-binding protein [Acidobacteria bacterium]|nr:ABC transporter ATP-binding protein [Acidobacteriota bacterium]
MSSPAISLRGLSKSFRLFGRRTQFQTLKSALLKRDLRPEPEGSVQALRGLTFDIARGEAFGVIGRNGSGKSTLLKIVSGILKPTEGLVSVNGRVSALIELGAGFHPEISGRENIYINGIMLGLSRKEIDRRFERIVEFSGIGEFLDQPVKTYSSGMYVRLGFAVAVHVDPEILIVDEVLSVGDEEFSQKCIAKIQQMKARGTTLVFVTHQLPLVKELCDRAVWIERGAMAAIGDPARVVDAYLQEVAGNHQAAPSEVPIIRGEQGSAAAAPAEEPAENDPLEEERWGSGEALITEVSLRDERGRQLVALGGRNPVTVRMDVAARTPQTDFVFGVAIYHADGTCVYGTNTEIEGWRPGNLEGEGSVEFIMPSLDLVAGSYRLDVAIHTKNGRAYDYRRGAIRFIVGSGLHDVGIYRPPHEWTFRGGIALEKAQAGRRDVPPEIEKTLRELDDSDESS